MFVPLHEMDLKSGARMHVPDGKPQMKRTWGNLPMRMIRGLF